MKRVSHKLIFAVLALCMAFTMFCPGQVSAASKNAQAHTAYAKKMKNIIQKNSSIRDGISYYYKDLNRDGVHEVLMLYHDYMQGSSDQFRVYTYKSGKVKLIASDAIYGMEKIKYYKSSKSFIVWSAGHGGEIYRYFKYSSGKYKMVASKSRYSTKGGYFKNGPWCYYKRNTYTSTSSSSFKKLIRGIKKGSASSLYSYGSWKICK